MSANRYHGTCGCGAAVAAGAGELVKNGGRYGVLCRACMGPVAAAQTTEPTVEVKVDGADVTFRPATYLGPTMFDTYRGACQGAMYDSAAKLSRAPLEIAALVLSRLREVGFRIACEPAVIAALQAWESRAHAEVAAADGRAEEIDTILRERGLSLFAFQRVGVSWLAPKMGALLADDMGLGKTIQALAAAPENVAAVVVCPAVARGVWARECLRWRPDLTPVVITKRGRFRFRWPRAGELVIINYDITLEAPDTIALADLNMALAPLVFESAEWSATVAKGLTHAAAGGNLHAIEILKERDRRAAFFASAPPGVIVIADEAHVLKNRKAARTIRFEAISDAAKAVEGRVWLLTGTPILNTPKELWSLLTITGVAKRAFGNWPAFCRLLGAYSTGFGTAWSPEGIDTDRAPPAIRSVMLRRLKKKVMKDLPAKTVEIIDVDLDAETAGKLDAIKAELEAQGIDIADAFRQASANQSVAFEAMSRARKLLATAKLGPALELVTELEEAGEPMVVGSAHRGPIDFFANRPGWAVITGDTPAVERTRIEEAFQRGELRGVAGTIKAMGVAITLTRANEVIGIDAEWTPGLNDQFEDRTHRIGQNRTVRSRWLRASHAIDQRVYELLGIKRRIIERSVDAAATEAPDGQVKISAALAADAEAARADVEAARAAAEARQRAASDAHAMATARRARRDTTRRAATSAVARSWDIDPPAWDTDPRPPRTMREVWAEAALQSLAGQDADRARMRNDVGFNATDSSVGHRLADALLLGLTDGEWSYAIRLAQGYPRQVGEAPDDAPIA